MELRPFLATLSSDERDTFAARCGTTLGHLRNVAGGHKSCAESLAINIERESDGVVTCEELRPDVDWAYLRGTSDRPREDSPAPEPSGPKSTQSDIGPFLGASTSVGEKVSA